MEGSIWERGAKTFGCEKIDGVVLEMGWKGKLSRPIKILLVLFQDKEQTIWYMTSYLAATMKRAAVRLLWGRRSSMSKNEEAPLCMCSEVEDPGCGSIADQLISLGFGVL